MGRTRDNAAVETMITMYQSGYNITQIAEAVYYSRSLVSLRLREAGYDTRKNQKRFRGNEPDTLGMIKLYQSGLSLSKVGRIFSMSKQGIKNRLNSAGITLRPPKNSVIPNSTKTHIKELYAAGTSFYKIAKLCGVSTPTVRKYAKEM